VKHISGRLAEFYMQEIEEIIEWLDSNEKIYCKLYFYDIIIILNTDRIKEERILLAINTIYENLTFKPNLGNNNIKS